MAQQSTKHSSDKYIRSRGQGIQSEPGRILVDRNQQTPEVVIDACDQLKAGAAVTVIAIGSTINKALTVADVIKSNVKDIHLVVEFKSMEETDKWYPVEQGLDIVQFKKTFSFLEITIIPNKCNEAQSQKIGYQEPPKIEQGFTFDQLIDQNQALLKKHQQNDEGRNNERYKQGNNGGNNNNNYNNRGGARNERDGDKSKSGRNYKDQSGNRNNRNSDSDRNRRKPAVESQKTYRNNNDGNRRTERNERDDTYRAPRNNDSRTKSSYDKNDNNRYRDDNRGGNAVRGDQRDYATKFNNRDDRGGDYRNYRQNNQRDRSPRNESRGNERTYRNEQKHDDDYNRNEKKNDKFDHDGGNRGQGDSRRTGENTRGGTTRGGTQRRGGPRKD